MMMMTDMIPAPAKTESAAVETSTAQTSVTETPATADREFLDRYSRIAREEARVRAEKKNLDAQKERLSRLEKLEQLAKEDPDALLSEFGWDFHKLTERHLSGASAKDPLEDIRKEIGGIKQEVYEKFSKEEKAKQEAALVSVMNDIRGTVEQAGDELEFVALHEAYDDVWELMTSYYAEHKEWLPIDKAARYVEQELEQQAQKFLKAKKLQKPTEQDASKDGGDSDQAVPGTLADRISMTLSNRMAPQPSATEKKEGFLSVNDLRQAALQAARERKQQGT